MTQSFSQFGEDVLAWKYFQNRKDGFYVEIGANHPTKYSQTFLFEQQGWKGILVEPLPEKCKLLRELRPGSKIFQLAVGAPEQKGIARFAVSAGDDIYSGLNVQQNVTVDHYEDVEVRTLDEVLAEASLPRIDFISIDVEGEELHVLRGFNLERHRPALMLLEDHLHHMRVHKYVLDHGYRLVKRTGCNNWYVPNDAVFKLNSFKEEFELRKEIWLDTPVRCVRGNLERKFGRKRDRSAGKAS